MMRKRMGAAAAMALLVPLTVAISSHATGAQHQGLAAARSGTSPYHRTDVAEQAKYARPESGPLHECIVAKDDPDTLKDESETAMGIHWLNPTLAGDAVLDPAWPEVLVYEPKKNGRQRLVALEYVVFADVWEAAHPGTTPTLFGEELKFVDAPNRYELPAFYEIHAWVWKHNPHGMFADHNPRVSCQFAD